MKFSCHQCGWQRCDKVQGKRFCSKCAWEENSGTENLVKEEMIFGGPQETDQPFIDEQDSHDVDDIEMEVGTATNGIPIPNSSQQNDTPRFCFNCGTEFAFDPIHQVNFCDQCGAQQMRRSQSSSFGANGPDYVLTQGMNIPHGGGYLSSNSLTQFSNSFQNTPPQRLGSTTLSSLPMHSPQDLPNSQFTIKSEHINNPSQRSNDVQQMQMQTPSSSFGWNETEHVLHQGMNIPNSGQCFNNNLTHFSNSFQNTLPQDLGYSHSASLPMFSPQGIHNCNTFDSNNISEQMKSPPETSSGAQQMLKPSSSLEMNGSKYVSQGINIPINGRKTSLNRFNNSFLTTSPQHASFSGTPPYNQPMPHPFATNTPMDSPRHRQSFSGTPYERPTSSPLPIPSRNSSSFSLGSSYGLTHLYPSHPSYGDLSPINQEIGNGDLEKPPMEMSAENPSSQQEGQPLDFSLSGLTSPTQTNAATNPCGESAFKTEEFPEDFLAIYPDVFQHPLESNLDPNNQLPQQNVSMPAAYFLGSGMLPFDQNMGLTPQVEEIKMEVPGFNDEALLQQPLGQYMDSSGSIPAHSIGNAGREIVIETDEYGDTTLHRYVQQNKNKEASMELLRLADAYVNDKEIFRRYLNKRNERKEVALQSAIKNRNVEIIDHLLKNGVDVTILDHSGNNILHLVVLTSSTEEMVLRLFRGIFKYHPIYQQEFNALLNEQSKAFNSEGLTIVHEVTKRNYGETLKYLKEKGADLNIVGRKENKTAMVMAAKSRNWEIVELLCALGACVNIPTSSEWYAVHAAIEDKNVERLEFFMKNGVDIYGYTGMDTTQEIKGLCDKYMRRRRRKVKGEKVGNGGGGVKQRRCKCESDGSQVH